MKEETSLLLQREAKLQLVSNKRSEKSEKKEEVAVKEKR